jgi:hypothetical protein
MSEKLERSELADLLKLPGFRKFLSRAIQTAGIFSQMAPTANGTDSRNLFNEGRRSLGLDILHDAARGIPVDDQEAAFGLLMIQVLREAAQTPQEQPRGRRSRTDELRDADDE